MNYLIMFLGEDNPRTSKKSTSITKSNNKIINDRAQKLTEGNH